MLTLTLIPILMSTQILVSTKECIKGVKAMDYLIIKEDNQTLFRLICQCNQIF